jgi:glucose/arabinose dehydrogenase
VAPGSTGNERLMRRRWSYVVVALLALLILTVAAAAIVGPARILARGGFSAADERLVTGLLVTGRAEDPVVYATSSDPRIGSGLSEEDLPLDTNSGVVSRLRRLHGSWEREDLVRGLPRSEENHATNGLALDEGRGRLYVAQGGMTNMGAPSARFSYKPEYALSGSVMAIDLRRLDPPYDLKTLDDETRAGARDGGDPFGGNGGRNQAVLDPGGPVSLFATGFRNPYDLVLTERGRLFTIDNGPAYYWGGAPHSRAGRCSGDSVEFGRYGPDVLYEVAAGMYAGHPNPTRANAAGADPATSGRTRECAYERGEQGRATFDTSTNGLTEYTAGSFDGALRGDLLAASIDGRVYRIELDADNRLATTSPFFSIAGFPLDVTAPGDGSPFAGTVWIADYATGNLVVEEPLDRRWAPHWTAAASSRAPRQEVSYVRLGDRFYLAGGGRQHEIYDPGTDTWSQAAPLPARLDHIQGVALDGRIYYVGGLAGVPEPEVGTVLIYDPASDSFARGTPMPRARGAGGVAVHDGRIYYAGGLHDGRAVPWFDAYDPHSDTWSRLPDMPRARDHFQAQVLDGRFFAIGGRDTDVDAVLAENDAFDFATGTWRTGLAPMPTPRAGYGSAVVAGRLLLLGGEATDRTLAEVEAYDPRKDEWKSLQPMALPVHGIQAVACGGDVYVAAGGTAPYGEAPTKVQSVYVDPARRCPLAPVSQPQPSRSIRFRQVIVPAGLENPTSIQFGPDGRLYVAEQRGSIQALSLHRAFDGSYAVLSSERIDAIRRIPNHDDDGSKAARWSTLFRFAASKAGICCAFPRNEPPVAQGAATRPGDPERGRRLFGRAGCGGCHTFSPAATVAFSGPPLDHVRGLPSSYVRNAIVAPDAAVFPGYAPGRMPDDYGASLNDQQLADLLAFLRGRSD